MIFSSYHLWNEAICSTYVNFGRKIGQSLRSIQFEYQPRRPVDHDHSFSSTNTQQPQHQTPSLMIDPITTVHKSLCPPTNHPCAHNPTRQPPTTILLARQVVNLPSLHSLHDHSTRSKQPDQSIDPKSTRPPIPIIPPPLLLHPFPHHSHRHTSQQCVC